VGSYNELRNLRRSLKHYRMTIDAGITGTGIALWEEARWNLLSPPIYTECFKPRAAVDEHIRLMFIVNSLQAVVQSLGTPRRVYIERPDYFQSYKGQVSAASGSLVILCLTAGAIAGLFLDNLSWVTVNDWKGQLPKHIVQDRIKQKLGLRDLSYPTDHEWDAVGIGLYEKGFL